MNKFLTWATALGLTAATALTGHAQSVGVGTITPAASAALEVQSTTQGLLLPRMTAAQRFAVVKPAVGLLVFQTDGTAGLYFYNGLGWLNLALVSRVSDASGQTMASNGGVVTTLAGSYPTSAAGSLDGTGTAARFDRPTAIAVDAVGNLYVTDQNNRTIRKITTAGVVTTLAGTAGAALGGADGIGPAATFNSPSGIAVDPAGVVYVADQLGHVIRKITPNGTVTTLAGLYGTSGTTDALVGTNARFNRPSSLTLDPDGNLYVADRLNFTIRKITPAGAVSTIAGTAGLQGHANGSGAAVRFDQPNDIDMDRAGNLYVAEQLQHTIRKITPAGVVSTYAGVVGTSGSLDGPAATATFNRPFGLAVDAVGNVYVGDSFNYIIRKIAPDGTVSTLAGTAGVFSPLTDGTGAAARFGGVGRLAVDAVGTLYVPDNYHIIRVVK